MIYKHLLSRKYQQISFSQCGEDLIVQYIFNSIGIKNPSYIDIGAHHPFYLNNTAIFSLTGSIGVNIEADPKLINRFRKLRQRDLNLNVGITKIDGFKDLYLMSNPTLNTFSKKEAEEYQLTGDYEILNVLKIPTLCMRSLITKYCNGVFPDFLSVDVEGIEMEIIEGIDIMLSYPKVICIETMSFSKNGKGKKNTLLIEFIKQKGYILYADTNINSIFVKKELWVNR
jgi:FkbM family methyltransferase